MSLRLKGTISVPGDKSISHRYALLAALAEGVSAFEHFATSLDCAATLRCLKALGVPIMQSGTSVRIEGRGLHGFQPASGELDAENSGTTLRLLSGILAGQPFGSTLTGDASLRRRPMRRIIEPLEAMGSRIEAREGNYAPLRIQGTELKPISYRMPVASAQVKSCVLLAGLLADGFTSVAEPAPTRDHTEHALTFFGGEVDRQERTVRVKGRPCLKAVQASLPGDLSAAAFFMIAALLLPNSDLVIEAVGLNETRLGLVRLLQSCGADVTTWVHRQIGGEPVGDLRIRYRRDLLQADTLTIAGQQVAGLIDEIPVLAVLGTQIRGGMVLREATELRVKESDRIARIVENLRRMGADVEELPDGMKIAGAQSLRGAQIATHNDHRIAMAFTVAGLMAGSECNLDDHACIAVSFPEFFTTLGHALTS